MDTSADIDAPMQESKQGTVGNKNRILRSLALALTANTPAFLRKGRYGTTHLSQRRAHGPIRL